LGMLSRLRTCLDDATGLLNPDLVSQVSPRGSKCRLPYGSLDVAQYASFCKEAAETVAQNILTSTAEPESAFLSNDLRLTLDIVEKLSTQSNIESVAALSLLVHGSKSRTDLNVVQFINFARACGNKRYCLASADMCPKAEIIEAAKRILYTPPLSTCLLHGLSLREKDIQQISLVFVYLVDDSIRGWCAPSMVVLNVYVLLNRTMHILHYIPLAVLVGHESRHALERMDAGDFNFSTPDKAAQIPSLDVGFRESGLGFELKAIGDKYKFTIHDDLVDDLISAIESGIIAGRRPALLPEDLVRFKFLKDSWNTEMPYDCIVEAGGFRG